MKWFSFLFILLPSGAAAQVITGAASAVDGDSLDMTGESIRLFGIDAPEATQTCSRDGAAWTCGRDAHAMLDRLVRGKILMCEQKGRDYYGRLVATCRAGCVDVAQALVRSGMAVALPQFSDLYVGDEAQAKANGVGIWSSEFQMPADFREANPSLAPKVQQPRLVEAPVMPMRQSVYFRSCNEARAAGAAPMRRGDPGYRSGLDGDNDGIACEPYRDRR